MAYAKRYFLVEWVVPATCAPKDLVTGLRSFLPYQSRIYGVATPALLSPDAGVWVGRAVVTVVSERDDDFVQQTCFERVIAAGLPPGKLTAVWSEIDIGDSKFERRAYTWLTTNGIGSFFGNWLEGQSERFKRTRLLNLELWTEFDYKLQHIEAERDMNEDES